MDLVDLQIEKRRIHGSVSARRDGAAFIVAEAEVRGEPAAPANPRYRPVEDVDQSRRIFAMRVAAHGRLVDTDLGAACGDQRFQFTPHDRDQRFGEGVAVSVLPVRNQAAAQGVGTGHADLQRRAGGRDALESAEFVYGPQASRSFQVAGHFMFAALVVSGRAEAAVRAGFHGDARQEAVERQIEIEPGLFSIADHVETGGDLVMHRGRNCVVQQFGDLVLA